jgi:hypothetical protein
MLTNIDSTVQTSDLRLDVKVALTNLYRDLILLENVLHKLIEMSCPIYLYIFYNHESSLLDDMEDMKIELTCTVDFPYTTSTDPPSCLAVGQLTELLKHCLSIRPVGTLCY